MKKGQIFLIAGLFLFLFGLSMSINLHALFTTAVTGEVECVPNRACHPDACVPSYMSGENQELHPEGEEPSGTNVLKTKSLSTVYSVFCTEGCETPLDCGRGHCGVGSDGSCVIVPSSCGDGICQNESNGAMVLENSINCPQDCSEQQEQSPVENTTDSQNQSTSTSPINTSTSTYYADLSSGTFRQLVNEGDSVLFDGHNLTIKEIGDYSIVVVVRSEPQTYSVLIGSSVYLDIDGDGSPDYILTAERREGEGVIIDLSNYVAPQQSTSTLSPTTTESVNNTQISQQQTFTMMQDYKSVASVLLMFAGLYLMIFGYKFSR